MLLHPDFSKKDGKYSWLVLVTIVLNNFCCIGYLFGSAGVLSEVYPRLLNLDPAITNAIGSSMFGTFQFAAPFITILMTVVGCRTVAAMSCVLTVLGIVSSAFCTQLWHFILGYCLVGGVGISMNMLASIAIVPSYFERRKSAAYACIGLGEGIALVTYPYILAALLNKYDFQYAVLLVSPVVALSVTSAIVYIPKPETVTPRVGVVILLKSYIKPLRTFAAPFYLLNSYLWQGGLGGALLLLFNVVAGRSVISVAVLCYSILGFGFLIGTLTFALYLLKFRLNHYLLQILINVTAGVIAILIVYMSSNIAYYLCFAVMGFVMGLTIANMACNTSHIFKAEDVEYAFGFYQLCGGFGSLVVPLSGGLILSKYGDQAGLMYVGGHLILAGMVLIIPAVVRPELWKSQVKEARNSSQTNPSDVKLGDASITSNSATDSSIESASENQ